MSGAFVGNKSAVQLCAEVLNVDVGAETDVVGEVPADVIRVVVEDDVIGAPIPIRAVTKVIGSYAEKESAEPEAIRTASAKTPDVSATDFAGEVTVRPGMVKVIVGIVASRAMADPLVIGVDVRCIWVVRRVAE